MDFYDILAKIPRERDLAIQIAQKTGIDIPEFEIQLQIFNSLDSYSRERQPSFAKLAQLAKNFVQWRDVYSISFCRDLSLFSSLFLDARDLATKKMVQLAKTFDEWAYLMDILSDSKDKGKLKIALKKMLQLAQTFEQASQVWENAYHFEDILKIALQKMSRLAQTFEHWHELYGLTDSDKLKKLALKKMELNQDFDQWFKIWRYGYSHANPHADINNPLLNLALKKILELAQTLDHWCQIWYGASDKEWITKQVKLKDLALKKMVELL